VKAHTADGPFISSFPHLSLLQQSGIAIALAIPAGLIVLTWLRWVA